MNQIKNASLPPKRIAVIRLSSAGDIVLTSPALESLKTAWPDTKLIYLTKTAYAPLIEANPHVNEVVTWSKTESLSDIRRKLLAHQIDGIVDLHNSQRTKMLRWSLPSLPKIVWKKRPLLSNLSVRWMLSTHQPTTTIAGRYHEAVERLTGQSLRSGSLQYFLRATEKEQAAALLRKAGFNPQQPIIGVSPGAKWMTKRWPAEKYGQLLLRAHQQGFQSLITGSPDEMPLAQIVSATCPESINLVGKVPFELLGGIISQCSAFLANDSGPMHISRGLGVPTLAIFGSTAPEQFDFTGHGLVHSNEPCAPCHFYGRAQCPKKHLNCLNNITVDAAWHQLEPLLNGQRRPLVNA